MNRTLMTSALAMGTLILAGCPFVPPPEAFLAGFWTVTPADSDSVGNFDYEVLLDEDGVLIEITGNRSDGGRVSLTIRNATTTLTGNAVTMLIPTDIGTVTFEGTLSGDGNSIEGSTTREISLGDLEAVLPGGNLTLDRIAPVDLCEGVTCDPGTSCENGSCVPDDPCIDVTCDADEVCEEGVCVPDACASITCDPGESCVDGVCVPDDPCADVTCGAGEVCDNGVCIPDSSGPDPVAGEQFYMDNGCAGCHGPNGSDGFAPTLVGVSAQTLLEKMDGTQTHGGGTTAGVTLEDAEDIEAWIASLQ